MQPCHHILVRNSSTTFKRCGAVATLIDKLGNFYCPRHSRSGVNPIQLILERDMLQACDSNTLFTNKKSSLAVTQTNREPMQVGIGGMKSPTGQSERLALINLLAPSGKDENTGGYSPGKPVANGASFSSSNSDSSLLPRVSKGNYSHAIDMTDTSEEVVLEFNGYNYRNIGDLVEHHSVYLPKAKQKGCEWRLLSNPVVGEINGLPMFRGMALATNGVHVAIETATGALIFGHLNWFIVDPKEPESKKQQLFPTTIVKPNKQVLELESLFL